MIDAPKPKNERISMLCYFDWLNSFELMSDEQIGKLIKHILIYGKVYMMVLKLPHHQTLT